MSLIEQAAKRLEELRRAGVEIGNDAGSPAPRAPAEPGIVERAMSGAATLGPQAAIERNAGDVALRSPPGESKSQIVHLDLRRIAAAGIITPDASRSQVADEFRVVKRPLLGNVSGKGGVRVANGNLIMVTSALPGEGKSFSAVNLAMSIAMELDHTVLLVDADVARPSIPRMLGLEPLKGLLDVLVDDSVDLSDVLLRTDVEKLTLLQAGTQHPRATELLASDAMYALLDEMA